MVVNWNDGQTFWLNILNAGVGAASIGCILAMGGAVVLEVIEKIRAGGR